MNKEKKEEKPLVFISHIAEEKDVAIEFKKLIERTFPGKVDIFVSSDDESIPVGKKWLEHITKALKKCLAMVIICSPESVMQPWINFEVGVGWARDIPIIPMCHSGMEPSNLPMPLQSLKAIKATKLSELRMIFSDFTKDLEIPHLIFDASKFIENVEEFETQYTFWNDLNFNLDVFATPSSDYHR